MLGTNDWPRYIDQAAKDRRDMIAPRIQQLAHGKHPPVESKPGEREDEGDSIVATSVDTVRVWVGRSELKGVVVGKTVGEWT